MLRAIIKREILENLKSAKFLIAILIAVFISSAAAVINVQDYVLRHQNYLDAKEDLQSQGFEVKVFREPRVLSVLARGKDRDLGDQARISYMSVPNRLTGYMNVRSAKSPSLGALSAVDFTFLVRIILSLLVAFLAYGTVSEEKAAGTLKLVMANSLPRSTLLLGKLIAGMMVVLGSLAVSSLITLLIMSLHPSVTLSQADWARILLMLAASGLYLSVFYALGLFVSVKTERPAASLTILLQAWIVLVVVYPNLSVSLSKHVFPLPTEQEVREQKSAVSLQLRDEIKKANEGLGKAVPTMDDRLRSLDAWSSEAVEISKVDREFGRRQLQQKKGADFISALSPSAVYDQIMNRMALTDITEYERFMEGVRRLWEKHVERYRLRITDVETYKSTTLPDFSYGSETPFEALKATWAQWFLLFLFNLILFALASTSFLRKDLR